MNRVSYNFFILYVVELHNLKLCGNLDVVEPQGEKACKEFTNKVKEMSLNHHSVLVPEPEVHAYDFTCKTCRINCWTKSKLEEHSENDSSSCFKLKKLSSLYSYEVCLFIYFL